MLTGNPPHTGASAQQIIMKIITEPAEPVTKYRKSVPPNVAAAVAKRSRSCRPTGSRVRRRSPTRSRIRRSPSSAEQGRGSAVAARSDWRQRMAVPALTLSVLFAATTAWVLLRPRPEGVLSRYSIELPDGKGIGATQWSPMAVSPDGSKLAYVGETGRLLVRSRAQLEPVELAGTEGAFNPFFSRDGLRVGFMAGTAGSSEIKVSSLAGGPPITVTSKGVGGPGAAWGYDGFIYFDASGIGPLRRIRDTGGGVSEDVSTLDSASGDLQHNWPDPLPNGRGVLMVVDRGGPGINVASTNEIAVLDVRTHKHSILVRGVFARYSKSGHILYVTSNGVLMAVPFDQDRMQLTGSPVALLEGISIRRAGGGVDLTISENGTLWYASGSAANAHELVWASRAGQISEVDSSLTGDFGVSRPVAGRKAPRSLHHRGHRRTNLGEAAWRSPRTAVQADVRGREYRTAVES